LKSTGFIKEHFFQQYSFLSNLKGFPETKESEELIVTESQQSNSDTKSKKKKPGILVLHEDMDKQFWKIHANILQLQQN